MTSGSKASVSAIAAKVLSSTGPLAVLAVAGDCLALGAVLTAVAGGRAWLVVALGCAALVALVAQSVSALRKSQWRTWPAARLFPARLLLLAAAGAVASLSEVTAWFWVFVAIAGAELVGETIAAPLIGLATPVAANVPGRAIANDPRIAFGPLLPLTAATIALVAIAALVPGAVVTALLGAVTVVTALWLLLVTADAAQRIRARYHFFRGTDSALRKIAPRFALHYDAPAGTSYQVGMWLPELERIGEPFVVIVRGKGAFREVASMTDRPVLYRRALEDLDDCVVPSLAAVFYTNNAMRNTHMARYPELTHVQLNHGDSDKAPSYNPMFRMYDLNFVAGQAAVDRFADNGVWMPPEMFRIVGRPQVRGIEIERGPISGAANPTVLYAPTWEGFNADSRYSSLPVGPALVEALLARGCQVVFRPHPWAYRSADLSAACARIVELLEADMQSSGRRHLYGATAETDMSLIDCFNAADAMVSDVSSVVVDFLYSEKPLALVSVSGTAEAFCAEFPTGRAAYIIEPEDVTPGSLKAQLDAMLLDTELPQVRRELKKYYLGDIPESEYFDRFVTEARAAIAGKPPHQGVPPRELL